MSGSTNRMSEPRAVRPVADQLLTLAEVAARLAISPKTAQRRVYSGEIAWTNVATRGARRASIRVSESALIDYERRCARAAGASA